MNHCCTRNALLLLLSCTLTVLSGCTGTPPEPRPEAIETAERALELGVSSYRQHQFDKAQAQFLRALTLYRGFDAPGGIVSSRLNLARTALASGHIDAARHQAVQAGYIIERESLTDFDDHLSLLQASLAIESGQPGQARERLDRLLASTTDRELRLAALQQRTRLAFDLGDGDRLERLQDYRLALGANANALHRARLLRFEAQAKPARASTLLPQALAIYREHAHAPGVAATLEHWAAHALDAGQVADAADRLERALFIRLQLRDRRATARLLEQLATTREQLGEAGTASRLRSYIQPLQATDFSDWQALHSALGLDH